MSQNFDLASIYLFVCPAYLCMHAYKNNCPGFSILFKLVSNIYDLKGFHAGTVLGLTGTSVNNLCIIFTVFEQHGSYNLNIKSRDVFI